MESSIWRRNRVCVCACFPLKIKHWRTLMQAKPPLACHANLVAEWGGVAAREGSGSGGLRVWVWWGGGIWVHYVYRSATMNDPKAHMYFNTHASQLDAVNYQRHWVLFLCEHVSVHATQMLGCLCITVHVCTTPSCPLWLSFLHYVKHANLIELMTWVQVSTVHEGSLSFFVILLHFLLFLLLLL